MKKYLIRIIFVVIVLSFFSCGQEKNANYYFSSAGARFYRVPG